MKKTRKLARVALLALALLGVRHGVNAENWKHEELRRFPAAEAKQGVAVDDEFFYAIDNFKVGKYRKDSGERVDGWEGEKGGRIQHLNAGFVMDGRLYLTHSNFPKIPEESSVEILDVNTMKMVDSHRFENPPGSLTWLQWRDNGWYACFAHYARKDGPGPEATVVVRFDANWKEQQRWKFPKNLVAKFAKHSASCGAFGPEGKLYVTGHDARELYVLEVPADQAELKWIGTIEISAEGQAFAWEGLGLDQVKTAGFYSISRKSKAVIISRITVEGE